MPLKITAVIFDVYETLFHNDEGLWKRTFGRVCQTQGLNVEPDTLWRWWKAHEVQFRNRRVNLANLGLSSPFRSYREVWQECFQRVFQEAGLVGDPEVVAEMLVHDMGCRQPYGDAFPALNSLHSSYRLAAFSNADSDYLQAVLARHPLPFEAVLSSQAAQVYKPHPDAFHQIVRKLGISIDEALYVGDSLYDDVQGARLVGMPVVWINRRASSRDDSLPHPDYEISDLSQLPTVIQSL